MQRTYVQNVGGANVAGTMPMGRTATQNVASQRQRTLAYVTHIDFQAKDLKVWAQFDLRAGEEIEMRLTQLERISEALTLNRNKLEIGSRVVARFDDTSNQSKLYRSVVTKINDDDTVALHYMDYGNDATIPIDNIYDSFFDIILFDREALAKECVIDGIVSNGAYWNIEAVSFLQEAICYEKVEMEVCGAVGSKLLVQVYFGPQHIKVSDYLVTTGWAVFRGSHPMVPSIVPPAPAISCYVSTSSNIPILVNMPSQRGLPMISSMQVPPVVQPANQPVPMQQPSMSIQQIRAQQPVASARHPISVTSVLQQPSVISSVSNDQLLHTIQSANFTNQMVPVKLQSIVMEYKPRILKKRVKEECVVAHIQDPEEFFIQLASCDGELGDLMRDLNESYSSGQRQPLASIVKKIPCVARYTDDLWYRGLVKENTPAGIKVHYVDYGNDSIVPCEHVMPIEPRFMQPELLAVKCSLFGLPQRGVWSSEEVKTFRDLTESLEGPFIALVHDIVDETHLVELFFLKSRTNLNTLLKERLDELAEQQEVAQKSGRQLKKALSVVSEQTQQAAVVPRVSDKECVVGLNEESPNQQTSSLPVATGGAGTVVDTKIKFNGFPALTIPAKADDFIDVIVSYVDANGKFFVQLKQNEVAIEKLSQELNTLYASGAGGQVSLTNPARGQICAAKYSVDQRWYRGLILERLSPTQLDIFFVDYGNTERMSKADIKELRQECAQLPSQAIECRLDGVTFGSDPQLVDKFRAVAEAQEMVIRLVDKDENGFRVTLFKVVDNNSDYNINDYLLGKGSAPPIPQPVAAVQAGVPLNGFSDKRTNLQFQEAAFNAGDDENRGDGFGGNRGGGYTGGRRGGFGDRPSRGGGEQSGGFGERGGGRGGRFGDRGERGGRDGGGRFGDRGERGGRGRGGFNDRGGRGGRGGGGFGGSGGFSEGFGSGGGGFGGSSGNGFSEGFGNATSNTDGGGFATKEESNTSGWNTVSEKEPSSWDTPKAEPLKELKSTGTVATSYKEVPRFSGTLEVYFAYVDELPRFFVSKKDDLNQLSAITAQITGEFDNLDKVANAAVGQPCIAMYEGTPYRATILSVDQTSNEAEILYIDYGNKESKKLSDIKILLKKFAELYPIAIACKLDGVTGLENAAAATEKFQDTVESNEQLQIVIKNYDEDGQYYKVDLVTGDNKEDVAIALGLKEMEEGKTDVASSNAESTKETVYNGDKAATAYGATPRFSGTLDVYYAHVDELPRFFLSNKVDLDQLVGITGKMNGEFNDLDAVGNPVVGQACCASFEGVPYRATILSIDQSSNEAEILYVDHGNKESKKLSDIKILPMKFAELYPIAMACKFDGTIDLEKAAAATEKFKDMIANEEQLQAVIKAFDEDKQCYNVDLVAGENKEDVAVALGLKEAVNVEQIAEAVATDAIIPDKESSNEPDDKDDTIPTTYTPVSQYSGTLEISCTYVDELPHFFVSRKVDLDALDAITAEIQAQFEKWEVVENPTIGQPCCALFDGTPCRAVILSIDQIASEAEICYVDYGNKKTKEFSGIKKLPQEFTALSPVAIPCKLNGVTNLEKAKEAAEKFDELVENDDNLKIVIKNFDDEGQFYVVDIISGGENKDLAVVLGLKEANQEAKNIAYDKKEKFGTAYAKQAMNPGQTIDGQIDVATSVDSFWLSTALKSGFELMSDLLSDYSNRGTLSPLTTVEKGSICIVANDTNREAPFNRGVITNVRGDGQICDILLIDYGQQLVSVPATKLFNVPDSFTAWPPQSIKCRLYGINPDWINNEEKLKAFVDCVKGKEVIAVVKSVDGDVAEVEIKLVGAEDDVLNMILNKDLQTGDAGIKKEDNGLEKQLEEELDDM